MKLKTKAAIYRYTGLYLAEHERNEYINSPECKQYVTRMLSHPENDLTLDNANGLATGLWECDNGFARPICFLRYNRPAIVFKPIGWVMELYTVLRWDIQDWYNK